MSGKGLFDDPPSKFATLRRGGWDENLGSGGRDPVFGGAFSSENEALDHLDTLLIGYDLFDVRSQVPGRYFAVRPGREPKESAIIDRVLIPKQRLIDAGWSTPIGIEAKNTNEKLGPALCQAIDYTWAEFLVDGVYVVLDYIFLWPLEKQAHGAIASVMDQNRIGSAYSDKWRRLKFSDSSGTVICCGDENNLKVRYTNYGRKVGSR